MSSNILQEFYKHSYKRIDTYYKLRDKYGEIFIYTDQYKNLLYKGFPLEGNYKDCIFELSKNMFITYHSAQWQINQKEIMWIQCYMPLNKARKLAKYLSKYENDNKKRFDILVYNPHENTIEFMQKISTKKNKYMYYNNCYINHYIKHNKINTDFHENLFELYKPLYEDENTQLVNLQIEDLFITKSNHKNNLFEIIVNFFQNDKNMEIDFQDIQKNNLLDDFDNGMALHIEEADSYDLKNILRMKPDLVHFVLLYANWDVFHPRFIKYLLKKKLLDPYKIDKTYDGEDCKNISFFKHCEILLNEVEDKHKKFKLSYIIWMLKNKNQLDL
jgi:hypothetical protein